MTLVGEAGLDRCLSGCLAIGQESPRQAYASLNKVGMRCYAYLACEAPQEGNLGEFPAKISNIRSLFSTFRGQHDVNCLLGWDRVRHSLVTSHFFKGGAG
jgi:hypothetical protein